MSLVWLVELLIFKVLAFAWRLPVVTPRQGPKFTCQSAKQATSPFPASFRDRVT